MIEIKLTQGLIANIDDSDYDWISSYKWFSWKNKNTFYAATYINKKQISMHRFIMNITDSKLLVDHIDGNGLNNTRANLRPCNQSQNYCNRKVSKSKKYSKYLGVYFDKSRNTWKAAIKKNNKLYAIGRYKTEIEAAMAYDKKAIELHGEFARVNVATNDINV